MHLVALNRSKQYFCAGWGTSNSKFESNLPSHFEVPFTPKVDALTIQFDHYSLLTNDANSLTFKVDRGLTHLWKLFEVRRLTQVRNYGMHFQSVSQLLCASLLALFDCFEIWSSVRV